MKLYRLLIIILSALILFSCNNKTDVHNEEKSEEHNHAHDESNSDEVVLTKNQEELVGISVEVVKRKDFENKMEFPAEISYNPSGVISEFSPISGKIVKLNFEYGSRVSKDKVIAVIENPQNMGQRFEVKASSSGMITKKMVNVGQWIESGAQICEISNSNIDGVIKLYSDELKYIKLGQEVEFISDNHKLKGKIYMISPYLDPVNKTIEARAKVVVNENLIPVNSFVTARVTIGTKKTIVIPRTAILNEDEHYIVYVKRNDAYEKRIVEIGLKDKDSVEIVGGLSEGEVVVTNGAYQIKNSTFGSSEGGHEH